MDRLLLAMRVVAGLEDVSDATDYVKEIQ